MKEALECECKDSSVNQLKLIHPGRIIEVASAVNQKLLCSYGSFPELFVKELALTRQNSASLPAKEL